jgi:hypothetical protein
MLLLLLLLLRQIRSLAQVQRHIRMYGGVATGVSIFSGASVLQPLLRALNVTSCAIDGVFSSSGWGQQKPNQVS